MSVNVDIIVLINVLRIPLLKTMTSQYLQIPLYQYLENKTSIKMG